MDIELSAESVNVTSGPKNTVSVKLEGVKERDIVELLTVDSVVEWMDIGELLDEIGVDIAVAHFGLDKPE